MSARRTITAGIQTEETLRNLFNTFLSFSTDPVDNINKLVAGMGEMLDATTCYYNRLEGDYLHAISAWNPPPEFKDRVYADGHICSDVLRSGNLDLVFLQHLEKTEYAVSDPGIKTFGLRTYIGKPVDLSGKMPGILCAVFTTDFIPSTEQKEVVGIIASAIAVQESLLQKIAEIRDREHKLQTLIDNSPNVAIQFYDSFGNVKYWNKASEAFYGFSMEETKGRSLAELILDDKGYAEFLQTVERIDATGETVRSEWTITDKQGSPHHIVSTLFSVHPPDQHNGTKDFICMDVDLTELKNAEIKLKEYTTQLENLNATKDKFFSIIAHDLKNPFNAILGFSRILYNDYQELNDEEILKFVRAIRDSSENAFKLLQNLLVWSRLQTGHVEYSPEICSLNLIVNETLALLKPQAITKNIHVVADVEPTLQVYADENMVKTILRNLVSNAIKYSHSGGKVEVRAEDQGTEVLVSVGDTGIGMNPSLVARLFNVGESTERPGTANEMGTGLGLILCKEFLQKHNSSMNVRSEEGKGTDFSFHLAKYRMPS